MRAVALVTLLFAAATEAGYEYHTRWNTCHAAGAVECVSYGHGYVYNYHYNYWCFPGWTPTTCKYRTCTTGSYQSSNGGVNSYATCTNCPSGKYQDQANQRSCKNCPAGKTTNGGGKTSFSDCTPNYGDGSINSPYCNGVSCTSNCGNAAWVGSKCWKKSAYGDSLSNYLPIMEGRCRHSRSKIWTDGDRYKCSQTSSAGIHSSVSLNRCTDVCMGGCGKGVPVGNDCWLKRNYNSNLGSYSPVHASRCGGNRYVYKDGYEWKCGDFITKSPTTKNPTKKPTKKPTTKNPTTKNPTKKPTKKPTRHPTTKNPTHSPTQGGVSNLQRRMDTWCVNFCNSLSSSKPCVARKDLGNLENAGQSVAKWRCYSINELNWQAKGTGNCLDNCGHSADCWGRVDVSSRNHHSKTSDLEQLADTQKHVTCDTAQPTSAPTSEPTDSPTTAAAYKAAQLNDFLANSPWKTAQNGNDIYKCHVVQGCFVNRAANRKTWSVVDEEEASAFGLVAETFYYTPDQSQIIIDHEALTVKTSDGDEIEFPWECSCELAGEGGK